MAAFRLALASSMGRASSPPSPADRAQSEGFGGAAKMPVYQSMHG